MHLCRCDLKHSTVPGFRIPHYEFTSWRTNQSQCSWITPSYRPYRSFLFLNGLPLLCLSISVSSQQFARHHPCCVLVAMYSSLMGLGICQFIHYFIFMFLSMFFYLIFWCHYYSCVSCIALHKLYAGPRPLQVNACGSPFCAYLQCRSGAKSCNMCNILAPCWTTAFTCHFGCPPLHLLIVLQCTNNCVWLLVMLQDTHSIYSFCVWDSQP